MFTPEVGSVLTVSIPGEKLRATVRATGPQTIVTELTSVPMMTKTHGFTKGTLVLCRRVKNILEEVWQGVRKWDAGETPSDETEIKKDEGNAVKAGIEQQNKKREHTGANRKRASKKAGGSNKPGKRAKAPDKKSGWRRK